LLYRPGRQGADAREMRTIRNYSGCIGLIARFLFFAPRTVSKGDQPPRRARRKPAAWPGNGSSITRHEKEPHGAEPAQAWRLRQRLNSYMSRRRSTNVPWRPSPWRDRQLDSNSLTSSHRVIPAKAGISLFFNSIAGSEIPVFTGMTIQGERFRA